MKETRRSAAALVVREKLVAAGYGWAYGLKKGHVCRPLIVDKVKSLGGNCSTIQLRSFLTGLTGATGFLEQLLTLAGMTMDEYTALVQTKEAPAKKVKHHKVTIKNLREDVMGLAQELHAMIQDQREAFQAINDKLDKFLATPAPSYAPIFEKQLTTDLCGSVMAAVDEALKDNLYDPDPTPPALTPRMVAAREKARKEVAAFLGTTPEELERFPETGEVKDA